MYFGTTRTPQLLHPLFIPGRNIDVDVTRCCSGKAKAQFPEGDRMDSGAQAFGGLSELLDGLTSTLPLSKHRRALWQCTVHLVFSHLQPKALHMNTSHVCWCTSTQLQETSLSLKSLPLYILLSRSFYSALSWVVSSSRVLHPPYQTLSSPTGHPTYLSEPT